MKIGIDIGGSHIATGIVLENGNLIAKESRDINIDNNSTEQMSEQKIIGIIEEEISILLKKNNYKVEDVEGIGIAAPGNPTKRAIRNVVNLNIKEFAIADVLENKYNVPVKIRNDGKCAGLAEKKYGALKEYKDCIFLCIGTGVGSAAFLNEKLLIPSRATGFEFGHIVIGDNNIKCKCGNTGCFETYASMKRFKNTVIEKLDFNKDMPSEDVQKYIREVIRSSKFIDNNFNKENVIKTIELIDTYLNGVALGISNIIKIFEPEAICFGGSFSYYADIFLPILSNKIKPFNKELEYKLLPAMLKNDAGIIGATEL